ncbi:MAG TPA: hypothetical protein VGH90_10445 [Chthoniobacteraceae bacterium]|jgi:hypothetical protein
MKFLSCAALFLSLVFTALADDQATFQVGSFTFTRPTDWQWIPVASPMRKAQLNVPGTAAGQSAEVAFFYFGGGQGGDVDANVQRWLRQFDSKPDSEKSASQQVGKTKITLVSTEGTYHSGMPGGPTKEVPNQALLGAILESADGNVFVKMTGPEDLVKATRQKFIDFITTAAKTTAK